MNFIYKSDTDGGNKKAEAHRLLTEVDAIIRGFAHVKSVACKVENIVDRHEVIGEAMTPVTLRERRVTIEIVWPM